MKIPVHENNHSDDIQLAAGVVIERDTDLIREIAVIRRQRYGTEWSLPKGKLQTGESLKAAAVREAIEETGCDVQLSRFISCDVYQIEHQTKVVFYWLGRADEECNFSASEEVHELAWLSPEDAIERLSHDSQKQLLRNFYSQAQPQECTFVKRLARIYRCFSQSARSKRLTSSIAAYREEYPCLIHAGANTDKECLLKIERLLKLAEAAIDDGDIDKGWCCFHAARRLELLAINDPSVLKIKAQQIREESVKLNTWRKEVVHTLIPANFDGAKLSPQHLYDAALVRDEHFSNQAYKDTIKRRFHTFLASLMVIMVLAIVWLSASHCIEYDSDYVMSFTHMYPGVLLYGLLGAVFSAVLKSTGSDEQSRIPELTLALRVTLLRLLLGMVSALVIYLLLVSQLSSVIEIKIADMDMGLSVFTVYVIAFVSGSTERLVINTINKIASRK